MKSVLLRTQSPPLQAVEAKAGVGFHSRCRPSTTRSSSLAFNVVTCSSSSSTSPSSGAWSSMPEKDREELIQRFLRPSPFGPTPLLMRLSPDPPFVEKTRRELSNYCLTLEGEECYDCWKAYFELRDLEEEWSKEDVERLIELAGGLKPLIRDIHRAKAMLNGRPKASPSSAPSNKGENVLKVNGDDGARERCPVPDGIPKSKEELEEEERWLKSMLPDSWHTRLLRAKGKYPAWYTPRPDHETD